MARFVDISNADVQFLENLYEVTAAGPNGGPAPRAFVRYRHTTNTLNSISRYR